MFGNHTLTPGSTPLAPLGRGELIGSCNILKQGEFSTYTHRKAGGKDETGIRDYRIPVSKRVKVSNN